MDCSRPTYQVARKPHQCHLCLIDIDKGERYAKSATFDNGTAYTWETHLECERYANAAILPWSDVLEAEDVAMNLENETVTRDNDGYWIDAEKTAKILREYPGLQRQVDALRDEIAKRNGGKA